MELYILRHAIAVEREDFTGDDSERPLTHEGDEKMRRATRGMKALGLSWDVILSSPYRRAQDTAAIVASRFNCRRHVRLTNALTPRGNRRELMTEIARLKHTASVLIVGHEPYLSTLMTTLVFGKALPGVVFKKGGLCKLVLERVHHGRCAELHWLLTPRQLIAMAG